VVVNFIGYLAPARRLDSLYFTSTLDEAAELAVELAGSSASEQPAPDFGIGRFAPNQRYLRGLFSGGTLAYEAQLVLRGYLPTVYSNAPLDKEYRLANSLESQAHTVVDLGEDEFTVGRLHPMLDNELRIRRLLQEASDPEVAIILLDVVLGYGAHPDPASELAPAIAQARARAQDAGRHLEVIAVVTGTDEDPQGFDAQVRQLEVGGARVEVSNEAAARAAGQLARALDERAGLLQAERPSSVDLAVLGPLKAINVGLESFAASLKAQGAPVAHVDWRPPAGGDARLMAILERMKK
jgi:FdrA protein